MQGHIVNPHFSYENVSVLYTLDLGQHTLVLISDGSIDVLAHEVPPSSFAKPGIHLDEEETYHLFISLHHQFQQAAAHPHHQEEVQ